MKIKEPLKKFLYETFRPHSYSEYVALFSRGNGKSGGSENTANAGNTVNSENTANPENPENTAENGISSASGENNSNISNGATAKEGANAYPWLYSRVLLFGLLIFSIVCIGYSASGLNFLMVCISGGIIADLAFIVLLYELYPRRDLPLMISVLMLFCGAALSSALIYIGYGIADYTAPFAEQAWIAFVEETGKALTTILFIAISKRRDPMFCLIAGAAVGGGYSAFENAWLAYAHGFRMGGLSQTMEIALWRGLGTPFSHAAWAGLFGFALGREKPWKTPYPYAAYLFGYVMHFFVNFPLMEEFSGWKGYPISAVTGVITICLFICVLIAVRGGKNLPLRLNEPRPTYGNIRINGRRIPNPLPQNTYTLPAAQYGYAEARGQSESAYTSAVFDSRVLANVFAAAALFCLSLALMGPTCVFGGYSSRRTYSYSSYEEFLEVIQCGMEFSPDYDRAYVPYDDITQNFAYSGYDGELTSITQREQSGEYFYRYYYGYVTYYGQIKKDEAGNTILITSSGERILGPLDKVIEPEEPDPQQPDLQQPEKPADPPSQGDGGDEDVTMRYVRIWELSSISLEYNDSLYTATALYVASEDAVRHYFRIADVASVYLGRDDGVYYISRWEETPIRLWESVTFTVIFALLSTGCGAGYIIMKRRNKNVE